MSATCEVCGKRAGTGFSYSHSHIRTKRRWRPNLHRIKILAGHRPRRVEVCTRCLRSDRVRRAH